MAKESAYLYYAIVGCEAAFWLLLAGALAARYVLKRNRLSRALLLALPVVDILLLLFTALDLRAGAPATLAHGLATAYIGFTVGFGGLVVEWADRRVAQWLTSGHPPVGVPVRGWAAVRHELALWLRCIGAWVITLALLSVLAAYVNDEAMTAQLNQWGRIAFGSITLWLVFGPVWSLIFFRGPARG